MTSPAPSMSRRIRWDFARSTDDRMFTGVAGGLAARLGLESIVVRSAFLVLGLAAGVGVVLYLVAFSVSTVPSADRDAKPAAPGDAVLAFAFGLAVLGALLICRSLGLWPSDGIVFPVAAVAAGACVLWSSSSRARRASGRAEAAPMGALRQLMAPRAVAGIVLIGIGLITSSSEGVDSGAVITVIGAVGLAVGGCALVFAPWLRRLIGDLDVERRERIRSEERAEVAAHLHDSVLQTLALIQRGATQNRTHEVVHLARRQERELRAWLYGDRGAPRVGGDGPDGGRLSGAVAAMAGDVEADHAVTVEVVVVGDGPMDADAAALLAAMREATVNAATHAGVSEVSVFVEAGDREVTAYVRDRGKGFDPAAVPSDRHGIAHSIRARLERHGGRVTITTGPGRGTEVELRIPRMGGQEEDS